MSGIVVLRRIDPVEATQSQTMFIQYGHERSITEEISAQVDGRVIWGGDETIRTIRSIPLTPWAKEIVFPDRFSYALIDSRSFLESDEETKKKLIQNFYNDCFWYDQNTCASPRVIFWSGESLDCQHASLEFYHSLAQECKERKQEWPWSALLERQTMLYQQATTLPLRAVHQFQGVFIVVELRKWSAQCHLHSGFGLIYHMEIKNLNELDPIIEKRDQTLTYFGFSLQDLQQWIKQLNGRGIQRVVPIGKALQFSDRWDGYSLLHEFTRWIDLQ